MEKSIIGTIWEERDDDKLKYFVSLFDEEVFKFAKLKDALEFVKYNMKSFFTFEEIPKANIKYTNKDDISHFIVFKRDETKDDIIIYEQSMFDFMRTNPHQYPPFARRRIINDRNYTFSDVLRAAINWRRSYSIYVMVISLLLFIASAFLIVFGLEYEDIFKSTRLHLGKIWNQVLLFSILGMNLILTSYMGIGMFRSRNKLFQTSGDYQEINWLKWYRRRLLAHWVMVFSSFSAIAIMSFFTYELRNRDQTSTFIIILYANMGIWAFFALTTLYVIFSALSIQSYTLRKYFDKKDIKKYKQWKKDQSNEEVARQNVGVFLFPTQSSDALVRKDIEYTRDTLLEMSYEDRRLMLRSERKVLKNSIDEYLTYIRKNKYVDF